MFYGVSRLDFDKMELSAPGSSSASAAMALKLCIDIVVHSEQLIHYL